MMRNLCETERLQYLAGFDFLDLCLLGETGTGKTHNARLIHELSPRRGQSFVAVNCAELTPSIIEAELFGYEKGAFTGAITSKIGRFEAATGGTLFLDEIGELSANLQAKLLKVVEEKCVTRVGGNRPREIDVRIIYATHRDLTVLREDLRYRIAAHPIHLKPLRERREEIVSLARMFLLEFSKKSRCDIKAEDETLKLLEAAEWRGNVRELRSFVEKICLLAIFAAKRANETNDVVELSNDFLRKHVSHLINGQYEEGHIVLERFPYLKQGEKMESYLEKIEIHLLKNALDANNNNRARTARELGLSRSGLNKKLKRFEH
jgi:transcriptional regulator with GAF, ATPase, and Fis domain